MIEKPVSVPQKTITSIDLPNFVGGLYLNGAQNAPVSAFVSSKDAELTSDGYLTNRRRLARFLPDTVEDGYQIFPVLWEGQIYYFTLDDGKVKFAQDGDEDWTDCTGDNDVITGAGGMPVMLRVLDNVMVLNGGNGDKLCYVDLSTAGFPVVKYVHVDDPTVAMTDTLTGLTSGAFNVYYAYNYSGPAGETLLSPILTVSVNHTRDEWTSLGTPGKITLTFADTPPAGATFRNLYVAIAATAGSIQDSDMLQLATKLDLSVTSFVDDGTLSINLGSVAPIANSTDGPRVTHGIVEDGNPILWGDIDAPYNIWIGGGGPYAMDFSISNGGYTAQPEKGTNYYPATIIGFRNGQGIPSLTILYSNTEGLSKQAVLEQQTVNYGDQSFTVWGVTEQHYGAAGVISGNSAINYNGKLLFFSTDGVMSAETQPTVQNVLAIKQVSIPIDELIRSIKNEAADKVVGAGWNNKYMWLIPNDGFDTPQKILILDTNNKGIDGQGAWYTLDIPAQWIGVISPKDTAAFVYLRQGKKSYKLLDALTTYDTVGGVNQPFSTNARGALIGVNGAAHNQWQADVQVMFYVMGLIGDITLGVDYYDQDGKLKTKTKTITGPEFKPSTAGGWGDPQWNYGNFPLIPGWGGSPDIDDSVSSVTPIDKRIPVLIDDIFNEAQWFYSTPVGYSAYKIRAISFEGIDLGVRPDLQ